MFLLSIHELDEVSETLTTTGYLEISWIDDFLQWTPANFGGIEHIFLPQDDVWKPDVALKNSMVDYKQLGVPSLNVDVTSEGEVLWYPFQVYSFILDAYGQADLHFYCLHMVQTGFLMT